MDAVTDDDLILMYRRGDADAFDALFDRYHAPVYHFARAVLAARRAVSRVLRRPHTPEVMTLDEVAAFLRVGPDELAEVVELLPAFELAGRIRVRRARLIEWIEQRERDYTRQATGSWAARAAGEEFQQGAL